MEFEKLSCANRQKSWTPGKWLKRATICRVEALEQCTPLMKFCRVFLAPGSSGGWPGPSRFVMPQFGPFSLFHELFFFCCAAAVKLSSPLTNAAGHQKESCVCGRIRKKIAKNGRQVRTVGTAAIHTREKNPRLERSQKRA